MAKVKGSNPPVRELLYTDADGVLYFFGEFYRQLLQEPSLSPWDPEEDITGKSSRGDRPTQQGDGSIDQEPIRQAFQDCAQLWNSLPTECPDPLPDPFPTSKKSVWQAKLDLGVVCSYYDLFLRCCMEYALSHGGAMPDGDCFPCESPWNCEGISISYTTQGMSINEEQELSVDGAVEGCPYTWAIASGGGSLSSATGTSIIYTAPSSNPNCNLNAVIELKVNDVVCDSLEIAIDAGGTDHQAYYRIYLQYEGDACSWSIRRATYYCNGAWVYGSTKTCDGCSCPVPPIYQECSCNLVKVGDPPSGFYCFPEDLIARCTDGEGRCFGDCTPRAIDIRSDEAKTAGCCPAALL